MDDLDNLDVDSHCFEFAEKNGYVHKDWTESLVDILEGKGFVFLYKDNMTIQDEALVEKFLELKKSLGSYKLLKKLEDISE